MATCTVKITKGRMNGGGCLVMVAVTYEPGNHQDDMAYAIESVKPQIAAQLTGECNNGMAIVIGDIPRALQDVVVKEVYRFCESVAVNRLVIVESRGNYPVDSVVPDWKMSGVLKALEIQPL